MKDIVYQYIYESEIYQRMMAGREAVRMQETERAMENVADMGEEQGSQII